MIAGLLASIIEWGLEKLASLGITWFEQEQANAKIVTQATTDENQLENAQTTDDKAAAASKLSSDSFQSDVLPITPATTGRIFVRD